MNVTLIITLSVIIVIVAYFYYSYRKMKNAPVEKDHENIKTLNNKNFQDQIRKGVTLVDFWAGWCMPCKMMVPVLNSVSKELDGKASVGKIDIERYQAMASKHKVKSIPTLILFKDGKEVNRFVGVKTKDILLKEIKKII
jgi:thioredoxin 1